MEGGGLLLRGGSLLAGCGGIAGREDVEGGSVEAETEAGADVEAGVDAEAGVEVDASVRFSSPLTWLAADAPAVFMRPFSRRYWIDWRMAKSSCSLSFRINRCWMVKRPLLASRSLMAASLAWGS